jgi:hypothetical protein
MPENLDNIKKWIAALRSGEYKQITGGLKRHLAPDSNEVGYCCLGVACEVFGKESGDTFNLEERKIWPYFSFLNQYTMLPKQVIAFLDLQGDRDVLDKLIRMNDQGGASFEFIADFLEKKYIKTNEH